ncbi:TolA-binding protein [Bradyrhizobium sp. GM6.1]
MADLSPHMQPDNMKPSCRRILPWFFALIALALLGGAVLWSNARDGAAPSADITQRASELTVQQQDQTAKQLAGLQQTLNDLRMAQQRLQEQLGCFSGENR